MIRALAVALALLLSLPAGVAARPADPGDGFRPVQADVSPDRDRGLTLVAPLHASAVDDTVDYGGTRWAADSLRWEALRDSTWTFDTGVGSAFSPTDPNKPAGYHTRMEGWYGIDRTVSEDPWFRRSSTCAIVGGFSFWAGVTLDEANALCYVSGQGYGNNWHLEIRKTFSYGGSGNASVSWRYAYQTENGFDFAYALIDTSGDGSADDIELASYTGSSAGTQIESLTLVRGTSLPLVPRNVVLKFVVDSDASYSDEDGLSPTTCGAFAVDEIKLSGAIVDTSTFESGPNGWTLFETPIGVGDYTDIVHRPTALPPSVTFCPCALRDSVLVFFDPLEQHPLDQHNLAASPWIDLKRGNDVGRPGKIIQYDVYSELPLANYVFLTARARWYPSVCSATGLIYRTPWVSDDGLQFFGGSPFCTRPGSRQIWNFSPVIETGAAQVQIAIGVVNLCRTAPFGFACTSVSNSTPWVDNVSFSVFGPQNAPEVTLQTLDYLQDAFASDGTATVTSTARIDVNRVKNMSSAGPGMVLGDTLVARGDGGNTEVRLVFRVRPGPFTSAFALTAWASQWTPEPSLGANWFSARMDTAEQNGNKNNPLTWMATFHESDPGFAGTDRTPDPVNPSQLENEILPDHILTPGSRIDYFVTARYLPPDPRNPSGTTWFITPDTTGGRYFEVEVLPSSLAADSTWNCTLYVDHHEDRERAQQLLEEATLTAALGVGSSNAEGTRFDRWDVQAPSSNQLSFGRPVNANHGASSVQAFAYENIVWHSASLAGNQLTDEDASIIGPWLSLQGVAGQRRFWGSGDGLATSMHQSGEPTTLNFLRSTLGTLRTCSTIRDVNCPSGSALDSTYCLPLGSVPGSAFGTPLPAGVRGNGCPDLRSFDLLNANTASVPSSGGQLVYVKNAAGTNFASVTNTVTGNTDYRTVLDGFALGTLRTGPANPHNPATCINPTAAFERTAGILAWFANGVTCEYPTVVSVPGETPEPPAFRFALGHAYPNPMNPTTRIQFTNSRHGGHVSLTLFDVTGRFVRTLFDGKLDAGVHEVTWDGTDETGKEVPSGLYFYRMVAGEFVSARKLMVMK